VFRELEKYFRLQAKLRVQFLSQIAWPVVELLFGIVVISGIVFFFGLVLPQDIAPFDPYGLGIHGTHGAVILFFGSLGTIAAVVLGLLLARRLLSGGLVDGLLLRVPVVGPCLRALALSRYCLAQRLTLETALSMPKAVRLSLRATGNAAYVAAADKILPRVREGDSLAEALAPSGLFPEEFLHVVAVGEESGKLTEVLQQQTTEYEEESSRRMTALTWIAGGLVFLLVVLAVGTVIIRFVLWYTNTMLNPATWGL
jgi:type IV pilus assembly protein PilC